MEELLSSDAKKSDVRQQSIYKSEYTVDKRKATTDSIFNQVKDFEEFGAGEEGIIQSDEDIEGNGED